MIDVRPMPLLSRNGAALAVADRLREAAATLENLGAWPMANVPPTIVVVGEGRRPPRTMRLIWDAVRDMGIEFELGSKADSEPVCRKSGTGNIILASARMFDSRLAQEMKHRGLSDIDVALVYLGHEIHHASEPERQGACGVLHSERDVRLLRGAHQALPSEWLDSARAIAPMETSKSSTVFVEALDAFDEGTADAVAVWLATKAGVKTPRLSAALAECRKARSTPNYQVSWLLDELDRDGLPQSVEELYVWCWRAALSRASTTADLSASQRGAVNVALAASVPCGRAPTP